MSELPQDLTAWKALRKNKKILDELKEELRPLYSEFYKSSNQYNLYKNHEKQLFGKLKMGLISSQALTEILNAQGQRVEDLSKDDKGTATRLLRSATITMAFGYLVDVEIGGNFYVNLSLLMLIGKGYDLHLEPDFDHRYTRHAKSLNDLESPSLTLHTKLDFLDSHGFPFFKRWIDRKLRNSIAHLNFEINDKGEFFSIRNENGKTRRKRVNLGQKAIDFSNGYAAQSVIFREQVESVGETKQPVP